MLLQQSRKSVAQAQQQTASSHTIKMISEKWKRISSEVDNQKASRLQQLQEKMKEIEKQALTVNNHEIKQLQDSINTLNQNVQDHLTQDYNHKTQKAYENSKISLDKSLQQQSQQSIDMDKRISHLLDWSNLQDQLSRNESQYDFALQNKLQTIADSVNQIEDILESEREQRLQSFEQIEGELEQNLFQLKNYITSESTLRRQKENKIFDMINDVHQNLQLMLQDEKKERQIMTNNLMQLMDDACIRIDRSLSSF
ncbi:unnamed protein product (macronuclear) [Paramecium tetraurelia]|uniref:HMG box domain-containing protein n=1 Tax=Paramecium tetraurelia TaxID=5888 RepID=A0CWQ4_PARTE|nr:uncharacterized protein GSPATT00001424001 [Paramecium tetraurelia]CAK75221.1 unnamed protein product [Paramecium tetraurelia]|eukprot:XP_001442618.1 hypothetical protein (macronuclear) [Paramecium tetraurelia strain d4-2]